MNRQHSLARAVESTIEFTARYLQGFGDTTHTRQGMDLPNHVAWNLGHCALTMHRVADMLDGQSIPESDFILNAAECDHDRFATEAVSFGSQPIDDPAAYPRFRRCEEIYTAACRRLVEAVRVCDDSRLDDIVSWGGGETTLHDLIVRMVFHNGMHCGQITDLRRALHMGSIVNR